MRQCESIAKRIDLMRVKSIIEDLPPLNRQQKESYNFDLPIMENESKLIKKSINNEN
jgi:hypothetical protein